MAEAGQRSTWNQTADLMAHLANCLLTEGGWTRADFHPFLQAVEPLPGLEGFADFLPHTTITTKGATA